jgi:hypothetical protein
MFHFPFRLLAIALGLIAFNAASFTSAHAEPLSKKFNLDFFRDLPSRNLRGLATRSDGRLVAGPVLSELKGPVPADLLWCFTPISENQWLIGTGPDGVIIEATLDLTQNSVSSRELLKIGEPHLFALRRLANGDLLAGTSPQGGLVLVREGKIHARLSLPVDSIFDLLVVPATPTNTEFVLVATGNPARIYRLNPTTFATAGIIPDKVTDAAQLTAKGLTLFGEIRDRNVRRLARFADGRIAVGSSPKGNLYVFPAPATSDPAAPASPLLLQENRDAEVTDLLPQANGDLYATLVFASTAADARINLAPTKPKEKIDPIVTPPPVAFTPPVEKFSDRSTLVFIPAQGFPENLVTRSNLAFYQLARTGDTLLIAGGELGELLGYDLKNRIPLTFSGSTSSQLNALAAIPGAPGRFLLLRNNAPGLAVLDFNANAERSAETRRLDLGTPALLGALRFDHLRNLTHEQLSLEIKTSFGSDEIEGWTDWTPLNAPDAADPAWRGAALRGRYAKLRLKLPANATALEIEKPTLFILPQNRRPTLQEFRFLTPNFTLVPGSESAPSLTTSISQILNSSEKDDDSGAAKRSKAAFLASQIVPSRGSQIVLWTLADPDGDNLTATFSIRRENESTWTDLAVSSREPYIVFDTARLPDGIYFSRLVATETAPRASAERLSLTFETDQLVVDHSPPTILEATATRTAAGLKFTIHGRDALALLDGVEIILNNGTHETVEQPADGIRDGREETFLIEIPLARTASATAAEVTLYDAAGNATTRRITL